MEGRLAACWDCTFWALGSGAIQGVFGLCEGQSYCFGVPAPPSCMHVAGAKHRMTFVEQRKYHRALLVKVTKRMQNIELAAAFNKWFELIDIKRDKEQHKSKWVCLLGCVAAPGLLCGIWNQQRRMNVCLLGCVLAPGLL